MPEQPQEEHQEQGPRQHAWSRWLPLAMLVAGIVILATLIFTGSHTKDKARGSDSSPPSALISDAKARSAAVVVGNKLDECATRSGGNYDSCRLTQLLAANKSLAENAQESDLTLATTPTTYRVTTRAARTQNTFTLVRESSGAKLRQCTVGGRGGCEEGGVW